MRFLRCPILLPLPQGELLDLTGAEVDARTGVIALSAKRTKNGDAFAMPLPALAVTELVTGLPEGDEPVFALSQTGKPFQNRSALDKRIRKASGIVDFNFHHFRRTFATTLAELGVGSEAVIDGLLNHRQSTTRAGVIAAYNHASLMSQKTRVMEAWGRLVEQAIQTGDWGNAADVTPITAARSS